MDQTLPHGWALSGCFLITPHSFVAEGLLLPLQLALVARSLSLHFSILPCARVTLCLLAFLANPLLFSRADYFHSQYVTSADMRCRRHFYHGCFEIIFCACPNDSYGRYMAIKMPRALLLVNIQLPAMFYKRVVYYTYIHGGVSSLTYRPSLQPFSRLPHTWRGCRLAQRIS